MWGPREVLNELKWRYAALGEAVIHYVHRGAPNDERVVSGEDVLRLETSFMILQDAHGEVHIPYHRIFRIRRGEEPIWERAARPAGIIVPAPGAVETEEEDRDDDDGGNDADDADGGGEGGENGKNRENGEGGGAGRGGG